MILAGDIGGTHTRLALFEKGKIVGEKKSFPSHRYSSLKDIVREFLGTKKVSKACFGVAGPVYGGKAKITNLPWILEASSLAQELAIPYVHLLNDLEANAYGIEVLEKQDLFLLHEGEEVAGNKALLSAGTGLGEAALVWDGKKHHPFASEGGHASFAPVHALEGKLWEYLRQKYGGHVSYERVLSGPGLYNLYEFLVNTGEEKGNPQLKTLIAQEDPPQLIAEWARVEKDPACVRAVDWFSSIYGACAGDTALHFFSIGGLYLRGGIAPHMIQNFQKGYFFDSFIDKGRFKDFLKKIPVWVILNENTALLGAANYTKRNK